MIKKFGGILALALLAGCATVALALLAGCATVAPAAPPGSVPTGMAAVTAAAPATATLLTLAAANNTTVATLVTKGQLFCQYSGLIVAVASVYGSPTSVIGQGSDLVKAICASVDAAAVPVAQPTNVPLNTVPVVAVATAVALPPKV